MTGTKVSLERLFQAMDGGQARPEPVESEAARRARVVGSLRTLHVGLIRERSRRRGWYKRTAVLVAAALVALAGTALAGAGGRGPLAGWLAPEPADTPAQRAVPPAPPPSLGSPSEVRLPAPPEPVVATRAPELAKEDSAIGAATARLDAPLVPPPSKTRELEEVNRLFASARKARREHRDADALVLLETLLSRHPRSVLVQEALVERFRTLSRLGRAVEAKRQASLYLRRYPNGFAVEEARVLAGTVRSP